MDMRIQVLASGIAIVHFVEPAVFGDARAQFSAGADAEIAALKQKLRLMEQKLDKLQRQTAANTRSQLLCEADPRSALPKPPLSSQSQIAPSDAVGRCETIGRDNLPAAIKIAYRLSAACTSMLAYDYALIPLRLPRNVSITGSTSVARVSCDRKIHDAWNYALITTSAVLRTGFAGTASAGGVPVGFLPGGALSGMRTPISVTPAQAVRWQIGDRRGRHGRCLRADEAMSSNDILFMERAASQYRHQHCSRDFRSASARAGTPTHSGPELT